MSLFISLLISLGICFLALWLLPSPQYGRMRGCIGCALQAALELEKAACEKKPEAPREKP
jgi:hypothetical protein